MVRTGNGRAAENFFGDGAHDKSLRAGAAVSAKNDEIGLEFENGIFDGGPDVEAALDGGVVNYAGELRFDALHFNFGGFFLGFQGGRSEFRRRVGQSGRRQDMEGMQGRAIFPSDGNAKGERRLGRC